MYAANHKSEGAESCGGIRFALAQMETTNALDTLRMLYNMSNMNKNVSAREFLHSFSKLEKGLKPGESLTVTRRGAPLGKFTKEAPEPRIPLPDFEKDASRPGFDEKIGDKVLARLLADEALS